jgi:hypothetical protein
MSMDQLRNRVVERVREFFPPDPTPFYTSALLERYLKTT